MGSSPPLRSDHERWRAAWLDESHRLHRCAATKEQARGARRGRRAGALQCVQPSSSVTADALLRCRAVSGAERPPRRRAGERGRERVEHHPRQHLPQRRRVGVAAGDRTNARCVATSDAAAPSGAKHAAAAASACGALDGGGPPRAPRLRRRRRRHRREQRSLGGLASPASCRRPAATRASRSPRAALPTAASMLGGCHRVDYRRRLVGGARQRRRRPLGVGVGSGRRRRRVRRGCERRRRAALVEQRRPPPPPCRRPRRTRRGRPAVAGARAACSTLRRRGSISSAPGRATAPEHLGTLRPSLTLIVVGADAVRSARRRPPGRPPRS